MDAGLDPQPHNWMAVTISGRKSIANHPNTGVEIFLRVFNALKGLLQQFLNLHSQREKKSDNCHSNSDLMLVLQKAEQRGKKKKAWMKSCYGGAKGFSRITPLILANALHAHFTEKKTKAQEG